MRVRLFDYQGAETPTNECHAVRDVEKEGDRESPPEGRR